MGSKRKRGSKRKTSKQKKDRQGKLQSTPKVEQSMVGPIQQASQEEEVLQNKHLNNSQDEEPGMAPIQEAANLEETQEGEQSAYSKAEKSEMVSTQKMGSKRKMRSKRKTSKQKKARQGKPHSMSKVEGLGMAPVQEAVNVEETEKGEQSAYSKAGETQRPKQKTRAKQETSKQKKSRQGKPHSKSEHEQSVVEPIQHALQEEEMLKNKHLNNSQDEDPGMAPIQKAVNLEETWEGEQPAHSKAEETQMGAKRKMGSKWKTSKQKKARKGNTQSTSEAEETQMGAKRKMGSKWKTSKQKKARKGNTQSTSELELSMMGPIQHASQEEEVLQNKHLNNSQVEEPGAASMQEVVNLEEENEGEQSAYSKAGETQRPKLKRRAKQKTSKRKKSRKGKPDSKSEHEQSVMEPIQHALQEEEILQNKHLNNSQAEDPGMASVQEAVNLEKTWEGEQSALSNAEDPGMASVQEAVNLEKTWEGEQSALSNAEDPGMASVQEAVNLEKTWEGEQSALSNAKDPGMASVQEAVNLEKTWEGEQSALSNAEDPGMASVQEAVNLEKTWEGEQSALSNAKDPGMASVQEAVNLEKTWEGEQSALSNAEDPGMASVQEAVNLEKTWEGEQSALSNAEDPGMASVQEAVNLEKTWEGEQSALSNAEDPGMASVQEAVNLEKTCEGEQSALSNAEDPGMASVQEAVNLEETCEGEQSAISNVEETQMGAKRKMGSKWKTSKQKKARKGYTHSTSKLELSMMGPIQHASQEEEVLQNKHLNNSQVEEAGVASMQEVVNLEEENEGEQSAYSKVGEPHLCFRWKISKQNETWQLKQQSTFRGEQSKIGPAQLTSPEELVRQCKHPDSQAEESQLGSNWNTSKANMTEKSKSGQMKQQSMTKFELSKMGPTQHTSKKTFSQQEHTTICPVQESEMIPMQQSLNSEESQQREQSTYSQLLSLHHLHNWLTGYEEANVNFYSPQLCREIIKTKSNKLHTGIHSKYVNGEIIRCRVKHIGPNAKMIVATKNLQTNQPVIELKGKYMLPYELMSDKPTCSHNVNYETPRGPFIFSYEIQERGFFVCVDTRGYGNDARFVRRSCKPNAQIKHCFKQGMIHLYIVATKSIERNCEITIAHEGMLPYACNQSCNISENISGSAVKRTKKTTALGNDSGMMAGSNYVTDGGSQQPIHPIPSCSVVQQMTVQVKNKKRKTSQAPTREQNITKKPSQRKPNSTKDSRKRRSSFSRNEVTLVASSSINQPPTERSASKVINNETQPYHDIAEMEQVMLNDHTVERQQSETVLSKEHCEERQQEDYVARELSTSVNNERRLSHIIEKVPSANDTCQQLSTARPLPTEINENVSNHSKHIVQPDVGSNEKRDSMSSQECSQTVMFFAGISMGLSYPIYRVLQVLQVMESKHVTQSTIHKGHQTNHGLTVSVREANNRDTQDHGIEGSNSKTGPQSDLVGTSDGRYCSPTSGHVMYQRGPLEMQSNNNTELTVQAEPQTNHSLTELVPVPYSEYGQYYDVGNVSGGYKTQYDSEQLQQGSLMPIQNDGQEAEAVATKNHVVSDKLQHQEGIYKHLEMGSSITATGKLFHTLQMESGNTSSCVSREMKEPEQHVSAPVVAAPVFAGGEDTAVGSSQSNASYYESMANDVTMWMTSTFGKFLDSEEHLTGNEDTNLGSKN